MSYKKVWWLEKMGKEKQLIENKQKKEKRKKVRVVECLR